MSSRHCPYTSGGTNILREALARFGGFHLHLGVESVIFLLEFNVKEQESAFVTSVTSEVEGGVGNKGIPHSLEVLLGIDLRWYGAYGENG